MHGIRLSALAAFWHEGEGVVGVQGWPAPAIFPEGENARAPKGPAAFRRKAPGRASTAIGGTIKCGTQRVVATKGGTWQGPRTSGDVVGLLRSHGRG